MTQSEKFKRPSGKRFGITAFIVAVIFLPDSFAAFLFLITAGLLLHPKPSGFLSRKLNLKQGLKKGIATALFSIGLIVGVANCSINPDAYTDANPDANPDANNSNNSNEAIQKYLATTELRISQLTPEKKAARDALWQKVKNTSTHVNLVDSMEVSAKYLPLLTAISDGVRQTKGNNNRMQRNIARAVKNQTNGKDQMKFVACIGFASQVLRAGFPKEIVDVFERYKKKYGYFNNEAKIPFDPNNKLDTENPIPVFNIAPFFGLIDAKNPKVLDAIYESYNGGPMTWKKNTKNNDYSYLVDKKAYNQHLRRVYPNSPYVIDIDFEMSAAALHSAYQANEVAADQHYKNKKIAVTGQIKNIGKDVLGDPYVTLHIGHFESVICYFSDENSRAISRLRKGQYISIIGRCSGMTLDSPLLLNCTIWKQ